MAEILKLPVKPGQISLREAYCNGIRESNNALSHIDRPAVSTMIGYLTGAVVAFRITGDEEAANLCEWAAMQLFNDWSAFSDCVKELHTQLSR